MITTDDDLAFDIKWGKGPSRRTRGILQTSVIRCREALLCEWEVKVCQD